jgi:hypothetical protein
VNRVRCTRQFKIDKLVAIGTQFFSSAVAVKTQLASSTLKGLTIPESIARAVSPLTLCVRKIDFCLAANCPSAATLLPP